MKFTINVFSRDVHESKAPLGLNFNKNGYISGFTVESASLELAGIQFVQFLDRYSNWIEKYNLWVK